ncbi:MAG: hypothetical protein QCH99_10420 [Candidatus Bathyarchaeota archaeon]|nr:hypothetical protein [Candidatus Bathyarchaeum tardum]WGM88895.1 MAG: hypothetical protein NUK63_08225 [Candidatus Bathyarchaeum tardum]
MQKYAFIVLNLEKFWDRLCKQNEAGKKNHAFVRRGVVGPKSTEQLFFYVTHPTKQIQGYADFVENVHGYSKDLWESLGRESLLKSYDEYTDFLQGRKTATFVRFTNLKTLPNPVPIKVLLQIIGKQRMPQMGMYITKNMTNQLLSEGGIYL